MNGRQQSQDYFCRSDEYDRDHLQTPIYPNRAQGNDLQLPAISDLSGQDSNNQHALLDFHSPPFFENYHQQQQQQQQLQSGSGFFYTIPSDPFGRTTIIDQVFSHANSSAFDLLESQNQQLLSLPRLRQQQSNLSEDIQYSHQHNHSIQQRQHQQQQQQQREERQEQLHIFNIKQKERTELDFEDDRNYAGINKSSFANIPSIDDFDVLPKQFSSLADDNDLCASTGIDPVAAQPSLLDNEDIFFEKQANAFTCYTPTNNTTTRTRRKNNKLIIDDDDEEDDDNEENQLDQIEEESQRNPTSSSLQQNNTSFIPSNNTLNASKQQSQAILPQSSAVLGVVPLNPLEAGFIVPVKRGRGRPRKYPLPVQSTTTTTGGLPGISSDINSIESMQERIRLTEDLKRQQAAAVTVALQKRRQKEEAMKRSQEKRSNVQDEIDEKIVDGVVNRRNNNKINDVDDEDEDEFDDDNDSEEVKIDEKNFTANSAYLKNYRQRLIGRSSNSKIFELRNPFNNSLTGLVVKEIPHKMSNVHQSECFDLRNEYKFLKKMNHPRIISLGCMPSSNNNNNNNVEEQDFIRDRNFCGILLPQARGNLMQYAKLQRHGKISLSYVRVALRQTAEALAYLHENYISHNDIKPDNIFIFADDDFRLADFGFSMDLPKPNEYKRNSTLSQTLRKQAKIEDLKKKWRQRCKQYVAPELVKLLNGKRPRTASDERACDIFALGVTFFIVVFYQLPFCGQALPNDQRFKHFFKGQTEKFWTQFTSMFTKFALQENSHVLEMRDLFNRMLETNPNNRITIEEVINHPWLNH